MTLAEAPGPGPAGGLGRALTFDALWVLSGRGIGIVAAFAMNAIAARLLIPADFGVYLLATTIAFAAAHIAELGVPEISTRLVAEAAALGRGGRIVAVVRRSWLVVVLGSVATSVALFSAPARAGLSVLLPREQLEAVLPAIAILVVVRTLATLTAEVFRGLGDPRAATLLDGTLGNALTAALSLFLLRGQAPTLRGLLLLTALCGLAPVLGGGLLLAWRLQRLEGRADLSSVAMGDLLRPAGPNLVNRVALYALSQLDLWVVAALLAAADVAVYGVALRCVLLVATPLLVVHQVVPALIAGEYARGRRAELQRVLRLAATVAGAPALAVLLLLVLAGAPVLRFAFGDFYAAGAPVLAVLAVGRALAAMAGPCGTVLLMTGHQKALMRVSLVTVAISLPLMLLGARLAGVVGIAVAASAGTVAQQAGMWWQARRQVGISTHMLLLPARPATPAPISSPVAP